MENSKTGIKVILTLIVLFCGAILFANSLVIIDAGEVGVRLRFGKLTHEELFPGIHIKLPAIDEIIIFPTRVEKIDMAAKKGNPITALSVEGLPVTLDVTVLYRIDANKADEIYKNYGTDFDEKIVIPITREIVRNIVSQYKVEDLYSTKRAELQERVYNQLKRELSKNDIELTDFLLRNVKLPSRVVEKIEEKLRAKEEAEKMKYVLEKENLEAQRKIVEAQGIAKSNRIIANSLSAPYLQWYYLQALKSLATSPNNTFIIAPYDDKLIPLLNLNRK